MGKTAAIKELVGKTLRFGPQIALGNVFLTYGARFVSEATLSGFADRRNQLIQRRLSRLVDGVIGSTPPTVSDRGPYDNTIWVCWLQGEANMPSVPALCLQSIRANAAGRDVRVITLDNYADYVHISDRILEKYRKGIIKNCHFADILRISLLAQQGGVWFDATMLCTAPISEDFFSREFHSIKLVPYGNFVSRCRWAVYCLASRRGNRLFLMLQELFRRYLEENDYFIDYFLFDHFIDMISQRDADIRTMIETVPQSNPDINSLSAILPDSFSEERWKSLTSHTHIFKLNWKRFSDQQLTQSGNSFYNHLKELYLLTT